MSEQIEAQINEVGPIAYLTQVGEVLTKLGEHNPVCGRLAGEILEVVLAQEVVQEGDPVDRMVALLFPFQ